MRRLLAGVCVAALVAACAGGPATSILPSGTPPAGPTLAPTAALQPSPTPVATPAPTTRPEWPFSRVSCAAAIGAPMVLVALGTSETAGWAIRSDEPYSPQDAHPARYADILCAELGRPIELRSYFPSQLRNELAPLTWWLDKVGSDAGLRADLAEADIVVLWAMSSHDSIMAMFLPGACRGAWPDPLKGCLEAATSTIPRETDELYGRIDSLVSKDAIVLAADSYAPPVVLSALTGDPHRDEIRAMLDPYAPVHAMAPKHGFLLVETEIVFNGPSRWEMPATDLFQSDGVHPTSAGAQLIAETYAAADGLGGSVTPP